MVKKLWITFTEESNSKLNVYSLLNVVMGYGALALVKIVFFLKDTEYFGRNLCGF